MANKADIGDALGMIETRGLVGMIEAADAMLKTANVAPMAIMPVQRTALGTKRFQSKCPGVTSCAASSAKPMRVRVGSAWMILVNAAAISTALPGS